jgi:hypothetical protein
MGAYIRPWVTVLLGWFRDRRDLVIENAALRQQLAMYERRRPQIRDSDRLFWIWLIRLWPGWRARRMPWPAVNRLPVRVRLGIRHSVGRPRSGRCADSHTALQPAGHLE